MMTTGMNWSMSAIGPCFIAAAGEPSAWMYEISLSLSAPCWRMNQSINEVINQGEARSP